MNRDVFFVRHGRVGYGGRVSSQGYGELERVSQKLEALGFHAHAALAAPARRCVETARYLAYGEVEPRIDLRLARFGDFKTLAAQADELFAAFAEAYLPPEAKAVVACHDSTPTVLALRLIELRGGRVRWNLSDDCRVTNRLDQGEGILVCGTNWQLVTYTDA